MFTCIEVIALAMRQLALLSPGDEPEDLEGDDALVTLQGLYQSWAAAGEFGLFTDVYKTADYTALEGERVTTSGSPTITLPTTYDADSGEYGSGSGERRAPYMLSVIEVIDTTNELATTYVYDRMKWHEIENLELTDEAPLASYGQHGLAAQLAIAIADDFGVEVSASTARKASQFMTAVRTARTAPAGLAVYY